jgi:hypothetical protein
MDLLGLAGVPNQRHRFGTARALRINANEIKHLVPATARLIKDQPMIVDNVPAFAGVSPCLRVDWPHGQAGRQNIA